MFKVRSFITFLVFILPIANVYSSSSERSQSNALYEQTNTIPAIEIQTLASLLEQRKFKDLEDLLGKAAADFKADPSYEWRYLSGFENFGNLGYHRGYEKWVPFFEEWIQRRKNYASIAARGFFNAGIGSWFRGSKYTNLTPPARMAKAREYWLSAQTDLEKAIQINPDCLPAYSQMIRNFRYLGHGETSDQFARQSFELFPSSYYLRSSFLTYQQPKWGGSYEQANKYASQFQTRRTLNPRIWNLQGIVPANLGYQCLLNENYACAIKLYRDALSFGDRNVWLARKAYSHYMLGDYDSALTDSGRILRYGKGNEAAIILNRALQEIVNKSRQPNSIGWNHFANIP